MKLYNGDCLEVMKDLSDNSIDLLFCDLPYGQTSCKWDSIIDLNLFWKQVNRICKDTTPMFFTCSSKFGVSLINSNPKHFRYDLVWVKSAPCGFLNAKKMPMKKHEMVYVFYKKLPLYDLSSHNHKFKDKDIIIGEKEYCEYDVNKNTYGGGKDGRIKISKDKREHETRYEPPLPTSIVREENKEYKTLYGDINIPKHPSSGSRWEPPLPNSILEIKSQKGKHSTQKPTALMEWILKYYTKENDVVLDPTMGSGSTGVACKNLNRYFIGIEMNDEIFKMAEIRLNQ